MESNRLPYLLEEMYSCRNLFLSLCYQAFIITYITNASVDEPLNYKAFEAQWDAFLQANVDSVGRIDYSQLRENPEAIHAAYQWISAYSPDSYPDLFPSEEARFAYWLNAYNVAVIYGVVEHYPIDSVLDVRTD